MSFPFATLFYGLPFHCDDPVSTTSPAQSVAPSRCT